MPKALILWIAVAAISQARAAEPSASPLSQNSSGLTQNNESGLSQNRDGRTGTVTVTATATDSSAAVSIGIRRPVKPTPRSALKSPIPAPGKPLQRGQTPAPPAAAAPASVALPDAEANSKVVAPAQSAPASN